MGNFNSLFTKFTKSTYFVIILVLLLTLSVAANLYLFSSKHTVSQVKAGYKYLSPRVDLINSDNRIVNFSPLKKQLTEEANRYEDVYVSIYFEYLPTGGNFSINHEMRVHPASLVKIPIAIAVVSKAEKGEISLDDLVEINDKNKDRTWGDLYKVESGTKYSVRQLLELMLEKSDNTAKTALYQRLNTEDAQEMVDEIGMEELFDINGNTNSKEIAKTLKVLYYSSLLNKEDSNMLLEFLSKSDRNTFMGEKIDKNIVIAHKFGVNKVEKAYNDVGIVYLNDRPYIISILINAKEAENFDEAEASFIINNLSKATYEYIKGL